MPPTPSPTPDLNPVPPPAPQLIHKHARLLLLTGILAVLVIGAGAYYLHTQGLFPSGPLTPTATSTPSVATTMLPTSTYFTATPNSGTAPLTVQFSMSGKDYQFASIDFGNGDVYTTGTVSEIGNVNCTAAALDTVCQATETYTNPGTYTALLRDENNAVLDSLTLTVTGAASTSSTPSATIDQSSLTTTSTTPTITGTASGLSEVFIDLFKNGNDFSGWAQVTDGKWSFMVSSSTANVNNDAKQLAPGTYDVNIDTDGSVNGNILYSGTLTVQ